MKIGVTIGILAVLAIAAIAVSVFYYSGSQSSTGNQEDTSGSGASLLVPAPGEEGEGVEEMIVNTGSDSESQDLVVEITSSGFNPATLEISQGDKVTWTNKGSAKAWPASAVHPTHNVYPGFDAKRGLSQGESYSFIFEKVGSWNYHDHLSPSTTGKIIVNG